MTGTGVKVSFKFWKWIDVGTVPEITYRPVGSIGVEVMMIFCSVVFCEFAVRDTWLDPFE